MKNKPLLATLMALVTIFASSLVALTTSQTQDNYEILVRSASRIVLAASDTPARLKAYADYKLDGTADEVEINAAIASLATARSVPLPGHLENDIPTNGGKITLLPGTYNIAAPITNTSVHNLLFEGSGPGTVINNTQTNQGNAISFVGTSQTFGLNRIELQNFTVIGNYTDATTRSGHGVYIEDVQFPRIKGVHFLENGGDGLRMISGLESQGAQNKIITECQFLYNRGSGFYADNLHDTIFSNNHVEENYGEAQVRITNSFGFDMSGCSVEDGYGTYGLYHDGYAPNIDGNTFESEHVRLDLAADYIGNLSDSQMGSLTINFNATAATIHVDTCRIASTTTINGSGDFNLFLDNTTYFIFNAAGTSSDSTISLDNCKGRGNSGLYNDAPAIVGNLIVTGGSPLINRINAKDIAISNADVTFAGGTSTFIDVSRHFSLTSCPFVEGDKKVRATAAHVQMVIAGNTGQNLDLDIDGNGNDWLRLNENGNNWRTCNRDFTDVAVLDISTSTVVGPCTWTVTNSDRVLNFKSNTFHNSFAMTIDSTTAATPNFASNDIGGLTLTNNGPAEVNTGNF